eukprot:GHRQ01017304.1.p3 GENE.GHRQ01017304.1~~GHRQ01017304.1.p3  ORF type:complete len:127 (+),score=37.69 GHRQ01017304.1:61-441(+)
MYCALLLLLLLLLLLFLLQELFYEGSCSNAELIINLILAFTLVYIPITIAVVGKRLWIKYRSGALKVISECCMTALPSTKSSMCGHCCYNKGKASTGADEYARPCKKRCPGTTNVGLRNCMRCHGT